MNVYDAHVLACRWHGCQVDRSGAPYIQHVTRVAALAKQEWTVRHPLCTPMLVAPPADLLVVAYLHDILEDTHIPRNELLWQVSPTAGAALEAITRNRGEPYWQYIKRVSLNPIATVVKIADLRDHLKHAEFIDGVRVRKYHDALLYLTGKACPDEYR